MNGGGVMARKARRVSYRGSYHTIAATFEQTDENQGVTSEIECNIRFRFVPEEGDNWNDPIIEAHCEFDSVTHEPLADWYSPDERKLAEATLWDWAECWVDDHQAECLAVAYDDYHTDFGE